MFGKLGRTHGLKGELKFFPNDPEEIESLLGETVRVKKNQLKVQSIRGAKVPCMIK